MLSPLLISLYAGEKVGKQLWLDLNPEWYSEESVKVYGDIGVRKEFDNNDWVRYVVRPMIAYALNDGVDVRAGLGFFYMDNKEVLNNRLEIRPFQGLNYNYGFFENWNVSVYGRMEERFDYNTETWESQDSLRLRLRLRTSYKWDVSNKQRYLKATLSAESFKTVSGEESQINEQSRLSVGLERNFNMNQKVRLEVTWQRQVLFSVTDKTYSDIYFRMRYYPSVGNTIYNRLKSRD